MQNDTHIVRYIALSVESSAEPKNCVDLCGCPFYNDVFYTGFKFDSAAFTSKIF